MKYLILLLLSWTFSLGTLAKGPMVAKIILLKKDVQAQVDGKLTRLKKGDEVSEGTKIITGTASLAKLIFIDKTQLTIKPNSEVEVKSFPKNEAGIIGLVKGQLRSKVTKNYLGKDQDKSKLFIKTKTAAMGVRGTDFQVTYNPESSNTSLLTFEGLVKMNKVTEELSKDFNQKNLEMIINAPSAVEVGKGEFSNINEKAQKPQEPIKISPSQLETLKKSEDSVGAKKEKASKAKQQVFKSPIPPGVPAKKFASDSNEAAKSLSIIPLKAKEDTDFEKNSTQKSEASSQSDKAIKSGGFVDLNTGLYIPPPKGSLFDANTQTYIPPSTHGSFDTATGEYKNDFYKLTPDGNFVAIEQTNPDGRAPASNGQDGYIPPPPQVAGPDSFGPETDPYSSDMDPMREGGSTVDDEFVSDITKEVDLGELIDDRDDIIDTGAQEFSGKSKVNVILNSK